MQQTLLRKLALAEERINELERQLCGDQSFAPCLHLTPTHQKVLALMMGRDVVRVETIKIVLYDMGKYARDRPSDGCVRTFVSQMRAKLGLFNIKIDTVWGGGYRLAKDHKREILRLSGQIEPGLSLPDTESSLNAP